MLIVRVLFWILLGYHQLEVHLCHGQCINYGYFGCELGVVNMTSDGGVRLRRAMEKQTKVHVEKLIVSASASGPFLQKITSFVDSVMYKNYYDASFFVPNDNTISELIIDKAQSLRAFVVGTNTKLTTLYVYECLLDRLPQTLPNLSSLERLTIQYSKLMVLRLDMLVENQRLKILDLSSNQIRQLIPPSTGRPGRTLRIEEFVLENNLLEHLDMSAFAAMPQLKQINIRGNRIIHVIMSTAGTMPELTSLRLGSNKIVSLDIRNLTAPNLSTISLGTNALRQMPTMSRSLPKLSFLSMPVNNITRLDLSFFRPYANLTGITMSSNQITTVWASSPVRLPLSNLQLDNNHITTFNTTGYQMPNIGLLLLSNNRLKEISSILVRYPNVELTVDGNPISCNTLLPYMDKLKKYKLRKEQRSVSKDCGTTSSLQIDETTKVCCDK